MAGRTFALRQTVPHNADARELTIVHHLSKGYRAQHLPERLQQYHRAVQLCDVRDMDALLDHLVHIVRGKFNPQTLAESAREVHHAVEMQQIDSPRDADLFCLTCIEAACQQVEGEGAATGTWSATWPSPLVSGLHWARTAWGALLRRLSMRDGDVEVTEKASPLAGRASPASPVMASPASPRQHDAAVEDAVEAHG